MRNESLCGVDPSQEHSKEEILRDIRSPGQQIAAALFDRVGFVFMGTMSLVALLFAPAGVFLLLPLYMLLFALRKQKCRYDTLPMRIPLDWNAVDYGDVDSIGKARKARGVFYVGNELKKNRELWLAREDVLTHTLVLGTTGAGKTETLVSLAFNYLAAGSGFLYVDPKAAPKLGAQIYTMCRMMGRDDDFLLLSYMADKQGQVSMRQKGHMRTPCRQSNTQNPFAVGTANQLNQLLFALMPEQSSDNAIFANNAQTLISGLMFVLVELRDKGEIPLSIDLIRKYLMSTADIDALARRTDLSEKSILALRAGLSTVGWDYNTPLEKQSRIFTEQFGYARAYFGRALSLLIDNYGRIFKTTHGEVDAVDVITSRRIYVTLIPSMDKDPRELKNLGQICLSSIRNACGVGLGDKIQGKIADVLGSLPTDARSPFGVIVDEYAAIETPGFEILLTQGRGLGIAVTVASQDFAGIKRASEAAAEQIVSNCKLKMFMCLEDPRQTYELIKAMAGEAWIQRSSGWSIDKQTYSNTYHDNLAVSLDRLSRVDFRDLQKQVEGQMTAFFKGTMIRGRTFYANPPLLPQQNIRLNYQLKLQDPNLDHLRIRLGDSAALLRALQTPWQLENIASLPCALDLFAMTSRLLTQRELAYPLDSCLAAICIWSAYEGAPLCDLNDRSQLSNIFNPDEDLTQAPLPWEKANALSETNKTEQTVDEDEALLDPLVEQALVQLTQAIHQSTQDAWQEEPSKSKTSNDKNTMLPSQTKEDDGYVQKSKATHDKKQTKETVPADTKGKGAKRSKKKKSSTN